MKKGFTLAEVLITLLIIGIVAALTIPSVIANAQQQEFKTGLKKAVSVLNEAIQMNIQEEGETAYDHRDLFYYLQRHMSVLKTGATLVNIYGGNNYFFTTDGMRFERTSGSGFKLHESDADLYSRYDIGGGGNGGYRHGQLDVGGCGSYGLSNNPNHTINPPCIITVDVNGDKKPNPPVVTKYEFWANGDIMSVEQEPYKYPSLNDKKLTDVFNILITEDRAIPYGVVAQRAMYSK